jgi:predicted choloylglycine hydrolase
MPRTYASLLLLAFAVPAFAQTPLEYPFKEGKHGPADLKFIQGVPVLTVQGKPAEIGDQIGVLVGKNSPNPTPVLLNFLKEIKMGGTFDLLKVLAMKFKPGVSADHFAEMEAIAKTSGYELEMFMLINSIYDLSSGMGCSTFIAEKERSATGSPLFARNFDWLPSKGLPQQSMVTVYRPEGKRAFAIVTLAPIGGAISGMNDAGLCCTINAIALAKSKDKAKFDWEGTPTLLLFRRVLEECKTIDEAKKLLEGAKRTTSASLTLCDELGGAVFEITPKTIEVRKPDNGATCCTNHFLSEKLGVGKECKRLDTLTSLQKKSDVLNVEAMFAALDSVEQGKYTLHSMVFEPKSRTLHLKIGDGTTSATKYKAATLDLAKLFAGK